VSCLTLLTFLVDYTDDIAVHISAFIVSFAQKGNSMDNADYCRRQAQDCRRLLGLPQSEAVAQVLKNLCNSWVRLANQADLYAEIVRRERGSETSETASVGGVAHSRAREHTFAGHHSSALRKRSGKDRGL
jgi:hypothetical protein